MKYILAIKHLENLGNGDIKPININHGICQALGDLLGEETEMQGILAPIFKSWRHFSGNTAFPVPHPKEGAYRGFYVKVDKWDPKTEYGALRLELCLFIADELKKL